MRPSAYLACVRAYMRVRVYVVALTAATVCLRRLQGATTLWENWVGTEFEPTGSRNHSACVTTSVSVRLLTVWWCVVCGV